jgi:hypothetical protein
MSDVRVAMNHGLNWTRGLVGRAIMDLGEDEGGSYDADWCCGVGMMFAFLNAMSLGE